VNDIINTIPAFVYVLSATRQFLFTNREFNKVFGPPKGRPCFEVFHGWQARCPECGNAPLSPPECTGAKDIRLQDGRRYQVANRQILWHDGSDVVVGIGHDVTRERLTEQRLKMRERRIHQLTRMLSIAEEAERSRLARELHDGPLQFLALALLQAQSLAGSASDGNMSAIMANVNLATEALRLLIIENSLPDILDCDLPMALRLLAEEMGRRHGMRVRVDDTQTPPLAPWAVTFLYRACRELLINAIKHGFADSATVRSWSDATHLGLEVNDNGCGLPHHTAPPATGCSLGLTSIRRRCTELSGDLRVRSVDGAGTVARILFPLTSLCRTDSR